MKNTKLNLVVKTKDGAKASKIVGLLSKFLKSVDIPCRFELPNDESIQIGKDKPLFTFIFHSTAFFWKGLSELNIGRAYIEGKFDLKGDVAAFLEKKQNIFKKTYQAERSNTALKIKLENFFFPLSNPTKKQLSTIIDFFDDEFFYLFSDKKYHMYSQCIYKKYRN